jgi:hypothetical protein
LAKGPIPKPAPRLFRDFLPAAGVAITGSGKLPQKLNKPATDELMKTMIRYPMVLGGDGLINRFRRRRDADAMDEVGGHNCFEPQIEHR